ncbi:MAG: hypothetical protein ACRDU8_06460, partial [Egibacteraceae bacterium]
AQAGAIMGRLGGPAGDLLTVLEDEPCDRWPNIVRDELQRWVDADPGDRQACWGALVDGQVDRQGAGVDVAATWLGVLLELPPAAVETLIRALLRAWEEQDAGTQERFVAHVARALPRFGVPQWERLRATFNNLATELGQEPSWK